MLVYGCEKLGIDKIVIGYYVWFDYDLKSDCYLLKCVIDCNKD